MKQDVEPKKQTTNTNNINKESAKEINGNTGIGKQHGLNFTPPVKLEKNENEAKDESKTNEAVGKQADDASGDKDGDTTATDGGKGKEDGGKDECHGEDIKLNYLLSKWLGVSSKYLEQNPSHLCMLRDMVVCSRCQVG